MKLFHALLLTILISSCNFNEAVKVYKAELFINDSTHIPFFIHYQSTTSVYTIVNADEEISQLNQTENADSTELEHRVFNSTLKFAVIGDTLKGFWYNREKGNYKMSFKAVVSDERFSKRSSKIKLAKKWSVNFQDENENYPAIGLFEQDNQHITGTFLTETGDYRYLEGVLSSDSLFLSTFDFAHAFLFKAKLLDNKMTGIFYSGNHSIETFVAKIDRKAKLTDPEQLVKINDSLETNFNIMGISGEGIDINHALFKDKAIVVQLFGSWCPNCYDESLFLNSLYKDLGNSSVEFIGVAYERPKKIEDARLKIEKFRTAMSIKYPLAYGGPASKDSAQKSFPFLQTVEAFPTLIFFNKEHEFIGVHSGFSGPGTGEVYTQITKSIRQKIESLIEE